jgi:N-acetylglutamate synthase/N-acetylornithine aminotransferase
VINEEEEEEVVEDVITDEDTSTRDVVIVSTTEEEVTEEVTENVHGITVDELEEVYSWHKDDLSREATGDQDYETHYDSMDGYYEGRDRGGTEDLPEGD